MNNNRNNLNFFKYIPPKHLTGVLKCLSTENSQLKGNQNFVILF